MVKVSVDIQTKILLATPIRYSIVLILSSFDAHLFRKTVSCSGSFRSLGRGLQEFDGRWQAMRKTTGGFERP
jgi:hypothetical protein